MKYFCPSAALLLIVLASGCDNASTSQNRSLPGQPTGRLRASSSGPLESGTSNEVESVGTGTVTTTVTSTQTITVTNTQSTSEVVTSTDSQTATTIETATATVAATAARTITETQTATATATSTETVSTTHTERGTNTQTTTATLSSTGTMAQTVTGTETRTRTRTAIATVTRTHTAIQTLTELQTVSKTSTSTVTATQLRSQVLSYNQFYILSGTVTSTNTATVYYTSWPHTGGTTATATTTSIISGTGAKTVTATVTSPFGGTETKTATATMTGSGTTTGTVTLTVTARHTTTSTNAGGGGRTITATGTATGTSTQSWTYHQTLTTTRTVTNSSTAVATVTRTVSNTVTGSRTQTTRNTGTLTATVSRTATTTMTATRTATNTATVDTTVTVTETSTVVKSGTVSSTFTNTATTTIPSIATITTSSTSTQVVTSTNTSTTSSAWTQTATETSTTTDTETATETFAIVQTDAGTSEAGPSPVDLGTDGSGPSPQDNTAPETVIVVGPADRSTVLAADGKVSFAFSGSDDVTTPEHLRFQWRLDNGDWGALSSSTSVDLEGLADGRHRFEVAAVDEQGNRDATPASREFALVSYIATLTSSVTVAPAGTRVVLSGQATFAGSGMPAVNVPVAIRVILRGTVRTFQASTGDDGSFQLVFDPLPTEAGNYTAGVRHPAAYEDSATVAFALAGMMLSPSSQAIAIVAGRTAAGQTTLTNLGDNALTAITAQVAGGLPGIDVQIAAPSSLAANESATVSYTLTAVGADSVSGSVEMVLSSAEGASAKLDVAVDVQPPEPDLVISPGSIAEGMLVGTSTTVEMTLENRGGAPSAMVDVRLPAIAWMSLASPSTIAPLQPGQSTKIVLALSPPANLTLGHYVGALMVGNTQVPFDLEATSSAAGNLNILAQDELSFYDKSHGFPNLSGAKVTLTNPQSQKVVASGVTGADGSLLLTALPVGRYALSVQADRHGSYSTTLTVKPATTSKVTAFLSLQAVTYQWSVEPTLVSDTYNIQVTAKFETDVPMPVVTVDPAFVDLRSLGCERRQVDFTITNHGLIAAQNVDLLPQSRQTTSSRPWFRWSASLRPRPQLSCQS